MREVLAIVQARLGSSRFHGKVLEDLGGVPALRVLLTRLSAAATLDRIVVAIPDGESEDALATAIEKWGHIVFRGNPVDVLDRYVGAVREVGGDTVVRVTGDCPLIDPAVVDLVVTSLGESPDLDYVAVGPSYPEGTDCEAMSKATLEAAWRDAHLPSEREHVTLFIRNHPERFHTRILEQEPGFEDCRLTIDERDDLFVIRSLVELLGSGPEVGINDFARALMANPKLREQNAGIVSNEGLWRSLCTDDLESIGLRNGRQVSERLLERARKVIPGATQTLSKGADQFVRGVTPNFLASGRGCHVVDVDGNIFIDYPMALGPILLGYGYPRTVEAVTRQMREGTTFTLPHPLEIEVAELIVDVVPSAEMVRFAKSGSDVTSAAVRLARHVTGHDAVVACGYHGWHDWYIGSTVRASGVPSAVTALIDTFPFNDLKALEAIIDRRGGRIAAVIMEIGVDEPEPGFLEGVRDRVHRAGGIFILDEIVTGFRFAPGGAQAHYQIVPDLTCLGKAMANGLPLSAIAGRRELMEEFGSVFFSGTFGGETLSLAAAKSTIEQVRTGTVTDYIWRHGERLHAGIRRVLEHSPLEVELLGHPPRGVFTFRRDGEEWPELRALFLQETVRRGVLFGGPVFVTYAHSAEDIDRTVDVVDEVFALMASAAGDGRVSDLLDGPPPDVVFRPIRN